MFSNSYLEESLKFCVTFHRIKKFRFSYKFSHSKKIERFLIRFTITNETKEMKTQNQRQERDWVNVSDTPLPGGRGVTNALVEGEGERQGHALQTLLLVGEGGLLLLTADDLPNNC